MLRLEIAIINKLITNSANYTKTGFTMNINQYQSITPMHLSTIDKIKLVGNRYRQVHRIGGVVGELRSTLCTKTPLYVRSGSCIKQMPLGHLSYMKQMSLEHLSYIKETSWNTSGRT